MVKVAILGVEGSGKTVLFSVMGDRYETPDRNGLFLTPSNHETYSHCKKGMADLRKGKWPSATPPDAAVELDWQLMEKRREGEAGIPFARLSFLDFAGEVYRKAFGGGGRKDGTAAERNAVERLRLHVKEADVLVVLVDLSKIINGDEGDERTIEMNWLTQAMLSFAYEGAGGKSVALAFTQADRYEETLRQCGGVRGALAKYLGVVDTNYGDRLSLFEVSAVDRTVPSPDNPAYFLPAPDFGSLGLEELVKWLVGCVRPGEDVPPSDSPKGTSADGMSKGAFVVKVNRVICGCCGLLRSLVRRVCNVNVGLRQVEEIRDREPSYIVVDLSGGTNAVSYPVSYMDAEPQGGWTDEHKTSKLVLRRIPAGTFTMGSPTDELGRDSDETRHEVAITKPFYVGVFEVTQRQWELVMGTRPSHFANSSCYATRPVESVSYNDIRGSSAGTGWPSSSAVDATSFLGRLRAKTGLGGFDLPTEAQWEYSCRAGTTTALNSGKSLADGERDANMGAVGRYWHNGGSGGSPSCAADNGTAAVGSYAPNAWGLYDMHGNVWEWCLDWYGSLSSDAAVDPVGSASGSYRVPRGGCWRNFAYICRSANRLNYYPSDRNSHIGFRLCYSAERR